MSAGSKEGPPPILISQKKSEGLIEAGTNKDGVIEVFVHPYFTITSDNDLFPGFSPSPKYKILRNARLARLDEEGRPVLIFEEHLNTHKLGNSLVKSGFTQRAVVVPTHKNEPIPIGLHWKDIAKKLKKSGVQCVRISGALLELNRADEDGNVHMPDFQFQSYFLAHRQLELYAQTIGEKLGMKAKASEWIKLGYVPGGCVGLAAINFLSQGIDVSFSQATAPDNLQTQINAVHL